MDNLEIEGDGFDVAGFGEDGRDNMFGTLGMDERDREGLDRFRQYIKSSETP